MEEFLKAFFTGLTKAIADGVEQGFASAGGATVVHTAVVDIPPAAAEEEAPPEKPKRKRRTKKEIAADKAAAEKEAAEADDDDALDDDDDNAPAEEEEDTDAYEEFMDAIRGALRTAAKRGEGEGAKAKKAALAWLKENKGVDQFLDLKPSDYAEVLQGVNNAIAA